MGCGRANCAIQRISRDAKSLNGIFWQLFNVLMIRIPLKAQSVDICFFVCLTRRDSRDSRQFCSVMGSNKSLTRSFPHKFIIFSEFMGNINDWFVSSALFRTCSPNCNCLVKSCHIEHACITKVKKSSVCVKRFLCGRMW